LVKSRTSGLLNSGNTTRTPNTFSVFLFDYIKLMTYTSDTWVLKETIIQKLLDFERKILRRIHGPTKENQVWGFKTNEELDKLLNH